jgi:toxin-antitoxin system PIN domain toxin
MIAVDTSILAYAVNRFAPEHARAVRVVEDLVNGDRAWALPWPVLHEFLRGVTHPHVVARPLGVREASAFVAELLSGPSVHLLSPGPAHLETLIEVLEAYPVPDGMPSGLEIAVLLEEHGVREILSADRDLRRFAFLTVIDPVHGAGWNPTAPPARRHRVLGGTRRS